VNGPFRAGAFFAEVPRPDGLGCGNRPFGPTPADGRESRGVGMCSTFHAGNEFVFVRVEDAVEPFPLPK
jgi:hypothetical protein